MKTMRLTDEEAKKIFEHRAEVHHKKATFAFQVKSIQVANEYFEWCKKEGFYTPNHGTFINSFGYEEPDAKVMSEAVHQIWKLVFSFKIPKEKTQC
ncbi:hypothetical protein [Acinetobacter pittii]|uniref:hypothetical protein n=1 Tax=Acinetobacter pittii TaxID=48296 RepID=UPI0029FF7134|nr:hypothetical protein [Acinetobacter pittii]MDX8222136.1 hypothetical protein [Acinetobacter pittii]